MRLFFSHRATDSETSAFSLKGFSIIDILHKNEKRGHFSLNWPNYIKQTSETQVVNILSIIREWNRDIQIRSNTHQNPINPYLNFPQLFTCSFSIRNTFQTFRRTTSTHPNTNSILFWFSGFIYSLKTTIERSQWRAWESTQTVESCCSQSQNSRQRDTESDTLHAIASCPAESEASLQHETELTSKPQSSCKSQHKA